MLSESDKAIIAEKYKMYFCYHLFLLLEEYKARNPELPKPKSTVEIEEVVESSVVVEGAIAAVTAGAQYIGIGGAIPATASLVFAGGAQVAAAAASGGLSVALSLAAYGALGYGVTKGSVMASDAYDASLTETQMVDAMFQLQSINDQNYILAFGGNKQLKQTLLSSFKSLSDDQKQDLEQAARDTCYNEYGVNTVSQCFDTYNEYTANYMHGIKLAIIGLDNTVKDSDFEDKKFLGRYLKEKLYVDDNGQKSPQLLALEKTVEDYTNGISNNPGIQYLTQGITNNLLGMDDSIDNAVSIMHQSSTSLEEKSTIISKTTDGIVGTFVGVSEIRDFMLYISERSEKPQESFGNDLFDQSILIEEIANQHPQEMRPWIRQFCQTFFAKHIIKDGKISREFLEHIVEKGINEQQTFFRSWVIEPMRGGTEKVETVAQEVVNQGTTQFWNFLICATVLYTVNNVITNYMEIKSKNPKASILPGDNVIYRSLKKIRRFRKRCYKFSSDVWNYNYKKGGKKLVKAMQMKLNDMVVQPTVNIVYRRPTKYIGDTYKGIKQSANDTIEGAKKSVKDKYEGAKKSANDTIEGAKKSVNKKKKQAYDNTLGNLPTLSGKMSISDLIEKLQLLVVKAEKKDLGVRDNVKFLSMIRYFIAAQDTREKNRIYSKIILNAISIIETPDHKLGNSQIYQTIEFIKEYTDAGYSMYQT